MSKLIQLFILLSIITINMFASDFTIVAAAGKERTALYSERSTLENFLGHTSYRKRVKIFPSSHPVWKWRLGIINLQNRNKAETLLKQVQQLYPDAYLMPKQLEQSTSHKSASDSHKKVMLNFNKLTIKELIHVVSKITKTNIMIPDDIKGKINFIGTKPIREDKLFSLLNQVLMDNKYTLINTRSGFFTIVKAKDALKKAPPVYDNSGNDTMRTAILPFNHIKSLDLMKQAKSLVSKYGKVTAANSINSLIVTDYPQNIHTIREIIATADRSNKPAIKTIKFRKSDVDSTFSKATIMINSFFSTQSREKRIHVIKNTNANTLTLVGEDKDIRTILPYIQELDTGSDQKSKNIEIVYVKNSDAQEMAVLLNNLILHNNIEESMDNLDNANQLEKMTKSKKSKKSKKVLRPRLSASKNNKAQANITFDKQLNALIIFGAQKERDIIKRIIHQLDLERKQVYVQAKVLEINNDKASKVGMKYGIMGGVSNSSGLYALSNKMGLNDANSGITLGNSLQLALPNASKVFALGAAISLLAENAATNIISEPSILCINNEPASLYVGKTISVITQSSIATASTDLPRNTYSRKDVGLSLKILPRISSDHKVALNVEITSEDILPGSSDVLPKTTKRVVKTSAIVKNGETIILGGMVRDKISDSVAGIPIIKNIPLLGRLFSHKTKSKTKTTLVLMLTPYIIERSADLTKIKEALGKLYILEKDYARRVEK